jgi:hypothetical protein
MMMDQQVKTEVMTCGLVAGGEAELGFVTVKGDKTQTQTQTNTNTNTHYGSGSDLTGSTRDLVSAVSGFSVLHRKKRMARQRRSSSSTIKLLSFVPCSSSSTSHVPPSPLLGIPTLPPRVSFLF